MPFVSVTRLRIRSLRFLPRFALHTFLALRQVKKAPGFRTGAVLPDRKRAFWTMTVWDSQASMRQYMTSDAHKKAMPHLLNWCDEASLAHWEQADDVLPSWAEADQRMRADGRPSKVHHPSPRHANLSHDKPRTTASAPINRA
jgi:hypothetical protein